MRRGPARTTPAAVGPLARGMSALAGLSLCSSPHPTDAPRIPNVLEGLPVLHTLTTFYLSLSHNPYQSRPGVHGCLVSVPYRPGGMGLLILYPRAQHSLQPLQRGFAGRGDWSGCRISSWVLAVCVLIPKKSMPFPVMKTQNTFCVSKNSTDFF